MKDPFKIDTPARIAFSGGRTSAYMLWRILQAFGGQMPADVVVTFANTGKEVEETLRFVQECSSRWGVPVNWVEYHRNPDAPAVIPGKRPLIGNHGFRVVDLETASRHGEPFEEIAKAKAAYRAEAKGEGPILPNPTDRWCSGEMKHRTMDRFMVSIGYDEYTVIIGFRGDEEKRVRKLYKNATSRIGYDCPLFNAGVVVDEVMDFWRRQPFDLELKHDPELGTYEGNCDLCFLKNGKKMARLLVERPEAFDWWAEMEESAGARFRNDRPGYRAMADKRVALQMCEDDDLDTCFCG